MPKPVCVKCQRFFRPEKNGTFVLENKPIGGHTVPAGDIAPGLWEPYKLWRADKWRCLGCGAEICVGFGNSPVAENYMDNFSESIKKAEVKVNDC